MKCVDEVVAEATEAQQSVELPRWEQEPAL